MPGTLFQRTILLSGSAYASWAIVPDPQDYAAELSRHFNCSSARNNAAAGSAGPEGTGSSPNAAQSTSDAGGGQQATPVVAPLPEVLPLAAGPPGSTLLPQGEPVTNCLRDVPVRSLLSAPVSEPRYVTNFGPMVDGVVVSADPRWRPPGFPPLPKPFNVLLSLTMSESNHIFGEQELKEGERIFKVQYNLVTSYYLKSTRAAQIIHGSGATIKAS